VSIAPVVRRGEIWVVDWSPGRGSEQAGLRPAAVVQTDAANLNPAYPNVIVVTISTSGKPVPFHVRVEPSTENRLRAVSFVKCEQVLTIAKSRLLRRIGHLMAADLVRVVAALKLVLEMQAHVGGGAALDARGRLVCLAPLPERFLLLDGVTGGTQWEVPVGNEGGSPPRAHEVVEDLDGDGLQDLLVSIGRDVAVLSQRDGRAIWRARYPGITCDVARTHGREAADDIVFHGSNQQTMTAFAGRTGERLWQVVLEGSMVTGIRSIPDQDGDGVGDVVAGNGRKGLIALSGRGGRILWRSFPFDDPRVLGVLPAGKQGRGLVLSYNSRTGELFGVDLADGRTRMYRRLTPQTEVLVGEEAKVVYLVHPSGRTCPLSVEPRDAASPWPSFRHDPWNSGAIGR